MTIREMRDELQRTLTAAVGEGEAKAMANIILEDVKGYTPTELIIHGDRTLLDETVTRLRKIAQRVSDGEPLQYVIGSARFRGRDFFVEPDVLIPRPETAQLVDKIVDDYQRYSDLMVLDLGCGSGCIAVSLALDLPFSVVDAVDISQKALEITLKNANKFQVVINTHKEDIFGLQTSTLSKLKYDIIVSNPPYILRSEYDSMDSRVKDYEPHEALFVKDSAPIDIYIAIADFAAFHLTERGKLFLEINPLCASAIKKMLESKGFDDVKIERDYKGNVRFAIASAPR